MTRRGPLHTQLTEVGDDALDLPPAHATQVEAAQHQVHLTSPGPPGAGGSSTPCGISRTAHHLHDAGMGTAGDDDQSLLRLHRQCLLDDAPAHLAGGVDTRPDLHRSVHFDQRGERAHARLEARGE